MMNIDTDNKSEFCKNLMMLSTLVEDEHDSLDGSLKELAELVAKTLKTDNCSIMLLKENSEGATPCLRVKAHYGSLPDEAYGEHVALGESIAGTVAQTGDPLLVEDVKSTNESHKHNIPGGFITFPIILHERIVGVVNVNTPSDHHIFNQADLELASILSLFIAKSIQKLHLQNVLKSQYALAAIAKEKSDKPTTHIIEEPHKLVKILAKSFFNDMKRIGLGNDHIIEAATEIIGLLSKGVASKK